jgi:hypothetical protein
LAHFPFADHVRDAEFDSDNGSQLPVDVILWGVGQAPGLGTPHLMRRSKSRKELP